MNYQKYNEKLLNLLIDEVQKATGKRWEDGLWAPKKVRRPHILPLLGDNNNAINRANAIRQYMGFDCSPYFDKDFNGLHTYAHHINSSQITCLMFFSKLIDKDGHAKREMVEFVKKAFGIDISVEAKCDFEYTEKFAPYDFDADKDGNIIKGYEGTSFDFHIKDENVEIYFEIKLTEPGFHKEKLFKKDRKTKKEIEDKRHMAKARRYLAKEVAPQFFREIVKEPAEFLTQYQIYRNIIRVTGNNKYVVFISDRNNPMTKQDADSIERVHFHNNVIFRTWQQLIPFYPFELPFQLKAIQSYK